MPRASLQSIRNQLDREFKGHYLTRESYDIFLEILAVLEDMDTRLKEREWADHRS